MTPRKRRPIFPRLRKRLDNLKGRIIAKAIIAAYPKLLTLDPVKELSDFLKGFLP